MSKVLTIETYREGSNWFFDDETRKIKHEQFVMGVPQMIVALSKKKKPSRVRLEFSDTPFDGCEYTLTKNKIAKSIFKMRWVAYEVSVGEKSIEGWFCPCFWKFFEKAPHTIYVKAEALK